MIFYLPVRRSGQWWRFAFISCLENEGKEKKEEKGTKSIEEKKIRTEGKEPDIYQRALIYDTTSEDFSLTNRKISSARKCIWKCYLVFLFGTHNFLDRPQIPAFLSESEKGFGEIDFLRG